MSQKPDYYAVLGVDKKATEAEIKSAFQKIAMSCHPDMLARQKKTDKEKADAAQRLQFATEAKNVLTNAAQRAIYDAQGHAGLEKAKGSSGSSVPTSAAPVHTRRKETIEDVFDFFDRADTARDRPSRPRPAPAPSTTPKETPEDRAAKAAEARRQAREAARRQEDDFGGDSIVDDFQETAAHVSDATRQIDTVDVPVETLRALKKDLEDMLRRVDGMLAKKSGGPKPR